MKYLFLLVSFISLAQQTLYVDFKTGLGKISLNTEQKSVGGNVIYNFEVLKAIDTIKIDAQNMTFKNVKLNGIAIQYLNTNKELKLFFPFKKGKNKLEFDYSAFPKQALYFVGDFNKTSTSNIASQIWTQGQGKYTSNWFPSFDDVNEKVIFNLNIVFDKDYEVVSNGVLKKKITKNDLTFWEYQMQKPMSSYLLMLAIGQYDIFKNNTKAGVPLEMYLEKEDKSKFETTYRYSQQIFDFLENEIGVKYHWKIYKQIPVRDFLYAGMENTTATLFSSRYVVDSIGFEDRNYINVNAHELAHHWFGNLITASSGKHHWLQEGFATYYALLAERKIYGDDFFYSKMYEAAKQIQNASKTDTIPILSPKASSLSYYQKGAWVLFALHEAIGDKAFKKAIKSYLNKFAYKTVTTENFFDEIKKVSSLDLNNFSKVWLETNNFNLQLYNDLLVKNKMIQLLFEVNNVEKKSLDDKKDFFTKILQSNADSFVKKAIVYQLKNENFNVKKELLELALKSNNIQVRQAVALTVSKIPEEFRSQYESLLSDKSYQNQEYALYYLWKNFPLHRIRYLDISKDWIGFNDYNLRTLWLTLALNTEEFTDKDKCIKELIDYSTDGYEAITRENALEKLLNFEFITDEVLKNLVNATTHHMWQFSKFGRDSIRKLLKKEDMKIAFERILPVLNENEQFQLNRLLKELQSTTIH